MNSNAINEISIDLLKKILDHSSDEIYVFDKHRRVIYVNKMCQKHYGVNPEELIGKSNDEIVAKGYWSPSIIPMIFEEKKPMLVRQTTYIGAELLTQAIPILNEQGEVEMVICTARQVDYKEVESSGDRKDSSTQPFQGFITNSPKMKELLRFAKKVADVDTTVLIHGESGTGKGILANYIHQLSKRKEHPFVTINCAAIPEELLESELFGYVGGAFTGANKSGKPGLIEVANNGTLFLDEIGEISPKIQAKLLHVIQDRQFIPIGSREPKKVDIRIIAATNRSLQKMVEKGQFREDLYYRLNVIDLKIPPLRERPEDILPLTNYFLNKFNKKYGTQRILSPDVLNMIQKYSWPGNVRQLENVMERLVVISDDIITPSSLPEVILNSVDQNSPYLYPNSLDLAIEEVTKQLITNAYAKYGSTRKVAKELSISQSRASRLIRKFVTGNIKVT